MQDAVKELKPIVESTARYEELEGRIRAAFRKYFYGPLLEELATPMRLVNERGALVEDLYSALQSGRVTYRNGVFTGKFNSVISKQLKDMGAVYFLKTGIGGFKIPQSKIPPEIREAIRSADLRHELRLKKIDKKLSEINPAEVAGKISSSDIFDSSIEWTDRQVQKSLNGLVVTPKLSPGERKKIADEWSNNMDLWIRDFTEEQIIRLRKDVQEMVAQGDRHEAIAKVLQANYDITKNKAKFLARQETSLLMAKFKETRYTSANVQEYKWRCVAGSKLHPVRPSHKILDGKIFKWQDPPITTEPNEPVRRNNPGQDYNCRCAAIPIVRFR